MVVKIWYRKFVYIYNMYKWLIGKNDCSFVNWVAVVKYKYAGQEGYTNLFFKLLLTAVGLVPHKCFRILLEISVSGQWLKITNLPSSRDLPPPSKRNNPLTKLKLSIVTCTCN